VIRVYVEPSGESAELAAAEIAAAAEALGGGAADREVPVPEGLALVLLPDRAAALALASRLALARRCLVRLGTETEGLVAMRAAGAEGGTGAVRRVGRPSGSRGDATVQAAGAAFVAGGGRIDLEHAGRRFWVRGDPESPEYFEEIAPVDREAVEHRRMPTLPFQRPVALAPRLARASANLARIRPGDRVVDPFLGTGALLAEAGLLGASLVGIDRDAEMVRGAVRNLRHFGLEAEALVVGDSGEVTLPEAGRPFDALLTDPPYGRASGTGGEAAQRVVERVIPRWAELVRPGGRVVLVLPGGYEPLDAPWVVRRRIPVRVHRSLTREFRVYERATDAAEI
jgi:tRNA (guanine10-N2)-dimethyltransferase